MQILENAQAWQNHYRTKVLSSNPEDHSPDFSAYQYANNTSSPVGKGEALAKVRLLFISSSGAYIPEQQAPFDAKNPLGDYTLRPIPITTRLDRLDFAHDHYDQTAVREDPQTLIPLGHLQQKVEKCQLGGLTKNWLSFMGYQPDASRVVEETLPQIIDFAIAEKANGALLVPA
jgi:D-proline reductase (dithiol) PrdB